LICPPLTSGPAAQGAGLEGGGGGITGACFIHTALVQLGSSGSTWWDADVQEGKAAGMSPCPVTAAAAGRCVGVV
jgi:hypothetical protein